METRLANEQEKHWRRNLRIEPHNLVNLSDSAFFSFRDIRARRRSAAERLTYQCSTENHMKAEPS